MDHRFSAHYDFAKLLSPQWRVKMGSRWLGTTANMLWIDPHSTVQEGHQKIKGKNHRVNNKELIWTVNHACLTRCYLPVHAVSLAWNAFSLCLGKCYPSFKGHYKCHVICETHLDYSKLPIISRLLELCPEVSDYQMSWASTSALLISFWLGHEFSEGKNHPPSPLTQESSFHVFVESITTFLINGSQGRRLKRGNQFL